MQVCVTATAAATLHSTHGEGGVGHTGHDGDKLQDSATLSLADHRGAPHRVNGTIRGATHTSVTSPRRNALHARQRLEFSFRQVGTYDQGRQPSSEDRLATVIMARIQPRLPTRGHQRGEQAACRRMNSAFKRSCVRGAAATATAGSSV